jgi:hypothetical protein
VALCLLICGWFVSALVPSIAGRNLGATMIGEEPFTLAQQQSFTVSLHFYDLADSNIKADVHSITLPSHTEKILCVQDMYFREQTTDFPQPYEDNPLFGGSHGRGSRFGPNYEFKNSCTGEHQQIIYFYQDAQQDERVKFGNRSNTMKVSVSPSYYFPFDRRVLDVDFWLTGQTLISGTAENSVVIIPEIVGLVNVPEWDEIITIQKEYSEELTHNVTHIHIDFKRPITFRLLTVISLVALVSFIIVLAFVEEIGSFLEVAIAILLGLWGIQDIIIPDNLSYPTIITPIILSLYCLLAFAVFMRFVVRPAWKWFGSRSIENENESH